jgi:pteridine reductase
MDMDEFPLAVVTGAAHRLGRIFALTLARNGYAILLHYYHSSANAVSTASEIRLLNVPVYPVQADLADPAGIQSVFSEVDSHGHCLKVLINSAGVINHGSLQSITAEDWDATFSINLRAPFLMAQQAVIRMAAGGIIINVTEAGLEKIWSGYPAYLASKTGLDVLTRLQAKTYAPTIRVNSIAPGPVFQSSEMPIEDWEKLVKRLPIHQAVTQEQIALAVEFLLKNDSVTGQTVVVDNGYSLT